MTRFAVSLLEQAETLAAGERMAEAEPQLAEARETFVELGARRWLDRADALAGRGSAEAVG